MIRLILLTFAKLTGVSLSLITSSQFKSQRQSSIFAKTNFDNANQLKEMFPGRPSKSIENVLELHDNVSNAALLLPSSNLKCEDLVKVKSQSQFSTLFHCQKSYQTNLTKKKKSED